MKYGPKVFLGALLAVLGLMDLAVSPGNAKSKVVGLAKGYRGAVISVNPIQLMGIEPGDYVDVLVTFDALMKDKAKEKVTATILQNCRVLETLPNPGAVRLMLNPNEAQYAALSMEQGAIAVISRGEGDSEMKPMEMASFRKLFK